MLNWIHLNYINNICQYDWNMKYDVAVRIGTTHIPKSNFLRERNS